jgi:hypothetical protein
MKYFVFIFIVFLFCEATPSVLRYSVICNVSPNTFATTGQETEVVLIKGAPSLYLNKEK